MVGVLVFFTLLACSLSDVSRMIMKGHFPDSVPQFEVRRDEKGNTVTRGQIYKKLYGLEATGDVEEKENFGPRKKLLSYEHFASALQCSPNQPDLVHSSGSLHLMQWVPPTMQTLETTAAYIETRCDQLSLCKDKAEAFKKGGYPSQWVFSAPALRKNRYNGFEHTVLVRVLDNVAYWDWPWGRYTTYSSYSMTHPLITALSHSMTHPLMIRYHTP